MLNVWWIILLSCQHVSQVKPLQVLSKETWSRKVYKSSALGTYYITFLQTSKLKWFSIGQAGRDQICVGIIYILHRLIYIPVLPTNNHKIWKLQNTANMIGERLFFPRSGVLPSNPPPPPQKKC